MEDFKPYVDPKTSMPEMTFKAVLLGVLLAIVLGAANAYVGLKAGMTVSATFPAAVVVMAALRPFRGNILEENIARTAASVGEALIAGAVFTIPAFLLAGVWDQFVYWESTLIMLVGGVLGVLFIIFLRRVLVEESDLPFPESVACAEIVKAGQKGQTGAGYVFGAAGLAALLELFKNSRGLQLLSDTTKGFVQFRSYPAPLAGAAKHSGGILLESPSASPMLMGVGFIIGPRLASVVFTGGLLGTLVLIPLFLFLSTHLDPYSIGKEAIAQDVAQGVISPDAVAALSPEAIRRRGWLEAATRVWSQQVRPLAVGAMIVSALFTLFGLRGALSTSMLRAWKDLMRADKGVRGDSPVSAQALPRTERDLPLGLVLVAMIVLILPIAGLYWQFLRTLSGAILSAAIMTFCGLLFALVAGYLAGLIGGSNSPISGLTLSTLVLAAMVMLAMGITGPRGVLAVLGIASVICCAMGIAGDMIQDLKIGHLLGGTPWRMELAEIIASVVASLVLTFPMIALHRTYAIGSAALPAPQATLMAMMTQGIMGGQMAWPLILVGGLFAVALIILNVPSPMVVAVGMYLPFHTTAAIFVGGLFRGIFDLLLKRRNLTPAERERAENIGTLLASGLIAGESVMAVLLALLTMEYTIGDVTFTPLRLKALSTSAWPGILLFVVTALALIAVPLRGLRKASGT